MQMAVEPGVVERPRSANNHPGMQNCRLGATQDGLVSGTGPTSPSWMGEVDAVDHARMSTSCGQSVIDPVIPLTGQRHKNNLGHGTSTGGVSPLPRFPLLLTIFFGPVLLRVNPPFQSFAVLPKHVHSFRVYRSTRLDLVSILWGITRQQ